MIPGCHTLTLWARGGHPGITSSYSWLSHVLAQFSFNNRCQGKHREFGNFVKAQGKQGILSKHRVNTGNGFCSSGKCSDSKSKGHCDICRKKSVCVTNYVNWHRENLWSDRENSGNLKIQFEWVPWYSTSGFYPPEPQRPCPRPIAWS